VINQFSVSFHEEPSIMLVIRIQNGTMFKFRYFTIEYFTFIS